MTRIILSGCNGKMGGFITDCVKQKDNCTIVAGIDINTKVNDSYPVFSSPCECKNIEADVIIDFSHPANLENLLNFSIEKRLPIVICTTGLSSEQTEKIKEASKKVAIFFSANMSLGVNLLVELAKKAAKVLGNDFDIEIIEKHHNQKIDAPSGTALMIADAISSSLNEPAQYTYDRYSKRKKREKNEIGICSVRGGTIVGEHEIIFAGRDEIISLSHSAMSKEIFATGAVNAAIFMCGKQNGIYNMGDMV